MRSYHEQCFEVIKIIFLEPPHNHLLVVFVRTFFQCAVECATLKALSNKINRFHNFMTGKIPPTKKLLGKKMKVIVVGGCADSAKHICK